MLTGEELKTLVAYEMGSKVFFEMIVFAEPILKKIEFDKIDKSRMTREQKRKAKTNYVNQLTYLKKVAKSNTKLLDSGNEDESDELLDKVIDVIYENINVTYKP